MKLGKLSNDKLDSLILSKFGHMRKEVVCSPHVGVDCAAVDLGGRIAVLSTDPITAADKNIGKQHEQQDTEKRNKDSRF